MKKVFIILFIMISGTTFSGNLEKLITNLELLPLQERQAKADSFIRTIHSYPIIENDSTVIFIYQGTAKTVEIAGDFTGWRGTLPMIGISGTNLYYKIAHFESNARLEYKLIIDGTWILDPKNSNSIKGGMGTNSEFRMPTYKAPPEVDYYPSIPHGTIVDTSFFSKVLNNNREVKIYLPPGYSINRQYPVALFHDGLEFITLAGVLNILDYMIAHSEIQPLIAVFVPPIDRQNEYAGNKKDLFTTFIISELFPVIDKKYSTSKDPQKRATFGISDGGNIALYIGANSPESFGKVAAMSSDVQLEISTKMKRSSKMNLEFYLDMGTYDLPELIPMVNDFTRILKDKHYSYQYYHWHEGHSWENWRTHLSYPLRQFFPVK